MIPSNDFEKTQLKKGILLESLVLNRFKGEGLHRSALSDLPSSFNQEEPACLFGPISINSSCLFPKREFQLKLEESDILEKNEYFPEQDVPFFSHFFQERPEDHILLDEEAHFAEEPLPLGNLGENFSFLNLGKESRQFLYDSYVSNTETFQLRTPFKEDNLHSSLIVAQPKKLSNFSPSQNLNQKDPLDNPTQSENIIANNIQTSAEKLWNFDRSILKLKNEISPGIPIIQFKLKNQEPLLIKTNKSKKGECEFDENQVNQDKQSPKHDYPIRQNELFEQKIDQKRHSLKKPATPKLSNTSDSSLENNSLPENYKFTNLETFLIHFFTDDVLNESMCNFSETESMILSSLFSRKYEIDLKKEYFN